MGYKYTGDSVLGLSLTVNAPKPLDSRTVVDNLQLLYDIPSATAYQGMTVANIANGNIYMLVDKSKMNEKAGWKASYESIQIITCTEAEYNIWKENTNDDFTPINGDLTYLHPDTYYYIYEDSIENKGVYYVSSEEFEKLQDQVNLKASNSGLETLAENLGKFKTTVAETYITTESAALIYATKEELSNSLSESLKNYYTKNETDEKFVTKDTLTGSDDGESEYIFVTQTQLTDYDKTIQTLLDKTLKVEEDGSVENLTVTSLKSSGDNLNIETKELQINSEKVALASNVPIIETLEQSQYEDMIKNGTVQENVYYYTYSDENTDTVITKSELAKYYTINDVNDLLRELRVRIEVLEAKLNIEE